MRRPLLPPDPDLELLHTREYETRVFLLDEDTLLVRGVVRDSKPPGLYVVDDPEILDIHHMVVELTVAVPELRIESAEVVFESYPNTTCPSIVDHYQGLVGLNIARGFTHKVRELFGGPRGCTHTTALLQAMAPAVVQTMWSLQVRRMRREPGSPATDEQRRRQFQSNLNTCHVWHEDGAHVALLRRGELPPPPLQVTGRLAELGRDPSEWRIGGS